jgi:hypothetical protein
VRAFTALPGIFFCSEGAERAAASLLDRDLFSFWAIVREVVSFLFSDSRVVFADLSAASSFFAEERLVDVV